MLTWISIREKNWIFQKSILHKKPLKKIEKSKKIKIEKGNNLRSGLINRESEVDGLVDEELRYKEEAKQKIQ